MNSRPVCITLWDPVSQKQEEEEEEAGEGEGKEEGKRGRGGRREEERERKRRYMPGCVLGTIYIVNRSISSPWLWGGYHDYHFTYGEVGAEKIINLPTSIRLVNVKTRTQHWYSTFRIHSLKWCTVLICHQYLFGGATFVSSPKSANKDLFNKHVTSHSQSNLDEWNEILAHLYLWLSFGL